MKTYKITNTTNLVGRRDSKYNTIVNIEYIDNRIKKNTKLKAGDTVFLTVESLPLSIHRLRIKNLITVTEISATELAEKMEKTNPKASKNKLKTTKKPKAVKKPVIIDKNNEYDEVDTKKSNTKSTSKSSTKSGTKSSTKLSSKSTTKSSSSEKDDE
jgi:hypothetical protein